MAAPIHKSDKEWAQAVRKAVHDLRSEKGPDGKVRKVKALNILARTLVTAALDGDMQAMKEIGDRMDGKPSQAITGADGGPLIVERRTVYE